MTIRRRTLAALTLALLLAGSAARAVAIVKTYPVSSLARHDRSRGRAMRPLIGAGDAGGIDVLVGERGASPSLPSNGNRPDRGSLRCARTTPADSSCPLAPDRSPRGRVDGGAIALRSIEET